MKIGFYDPYFDSLGGGERYVLTLSAHWSNTHNVSIFWNDSSIIQKAQERFGMDLSKVHTVPNIFCDEPLINKLFLSSQYDLIFFLSDGSVPTSCATHNILHFQVPFQKVSFPFWKRMKIKEIVCNSRFTKGAIDQTVGKDADVIYPPVDIEKFHTGKKEKNILSVGRFSSFFQAKKQEVLIDIFLEGVQKGILRNWKLTMVGGLLPSDQQYFDMLTMKAKGFPITFLPNSSFQKLQEEYAKASFYWHGAGFGETDPQLMEHFGISTVEAMVSGCVPIVYNAGGQAEIIKQGKCGYLWNTKEECLDYTNKVIHSQKLQKQLQKEAKERVTLFSTQRFCQKFDELLAHVNNER